MIEPDREKMSTKATTSTCKNEEPGNSRLKLSNSDIYAVVKDY